MVCIYCGSKTKVTNSRSSTKNFTTWRRRECLNCHSIFSSYETPDYTGSLRVQTANGLEPFSRDVLLISINSALAHSKSAANDAGDLCNTVLQLLAREHTDGLLDQTTIVQIVVTVLQRYDVIAADVYRARHT